MTEDNYPQSLSPIYLTNQPNEPITLYNGPFELRQDGLAETGSGSIRFMWLPHYRIEFDFSRAGKKSKLNFNKNSILNLPSPTISAEVFCTRALTKRRGEEVSCHLWGSPVDSFTIHSSNNLRYVLFHLPNFHDYYGENIASSQMIWAGRLVLEAEGWRITIDSVENVRELIDALRGTGGYVFTHVGRLERCDTSIFSVEEAKTILLALFYFFSFVRGFWVPPTLPVGFGPDEVMCWQEWSVWKMHPWESVDSWFLKQEPQVINEVLSGFMSKWQDPLWNDSLMLSIEWYVRSNTDKSEESLIFNQVIFELLSWMLLVQEEKILSEEGYRTLRASDKLRLLLSRTNTPLELPATLSNLNQFREQAKWMDGPQTVAEIRNRMVHPKNEDPKTKMAPKSIRNILGYPIPVRMEAINLGLWYVERTLLSLFDYKGPIDENRLRKRVLF